MQDCRLAVKVQPGSHANEVLGLAGETLRVRVTAPPDRGKANQAVADLLAGRLGGRPRAGATRWGGAAARQKTFIIAGLDTAEIRRRLARV